MAFIVAALLIAGKVLLGLLAVVAAFTLVALVLPVKAKMAGDIRMYGDIDEFLEGDGVLGIGDVPGAAVSLTWSGEVSASLLGGFVSLSGGEGKDFDVRVLGIRVPALIGKLRAGRQEEARAGDSAEGSAGMTGTAVESAATEDIRRSVRRWVAKSGHASDQKAGRGSGRRSGGLAVRFSEPKKWLAPEVRALTLQVVKSLVRSLHAQGSVGVELGLPDPGVAGMAYAAFVTWSGITRQTWLRVTPNFTETTVSARVEGSIRVTPAQPVWIVGRFLLSREIRPLWRKKRAGESKKAPILGAHTTG